MSTLLEKKRYICGGCIEYLEHFNKRQIIKMLPIAKIVDASDGCRIDLDKLNEDIINNIYEFIQQLKVPHC